MMPSPTGATWSTTVRHRSLDRALLARSVLDRISSDDCTQPTLSEAMVHGTPVWRPWEDAPA